MNGVFEKRVRAAAVAGWWTLLIGIGFVLVQWLAYQLLMSAPRLSALDMGPGHLLVVLPDRVVLGHRDREAVPLALHFGQSLVDAVGPAIKETVQ